MRLRIFAALLLCAGAAFSASATYDFNFANPLCSTTVKANCLDHFSVGVVSSSGAYTEIGTFAPPPNATGAMTKQTGTFTGSTPVLGVTTFALLPVARDQSGNLLQNPLVVCTAATSGSCNTTSATIYLNNASNFALVFP